MKEFSQIVHIYLQNQVSHFSGSQIVPKTGQSPIVVFALPFEVANQVVNSSASAVMNSTLTLIADKLPQSHAAILAISRKAFVQLITCDANKVLGAPGFPAEVTLTPNLNADEINITAQVPLKQYIP